jgi:hypothetical protein
MTEVATDKDGLPPLRLSRGRRSLRHPELKTLRDQTPITQPICRSRFTLFRVPTKRGEVQHVIAS